MGIWKNIRGIWNSDMRVEAVIDAQVSCFKRYIGHHPERDPNAWLAMTLRDRPGWMGHEDPFYYTQTALFSLASITEAPIALGTHIAIKSIVSREGYDFSNRYWRKFLEIMQPIESLRTHDLLARWRTANPWTAIHFPNVENELPKMTKYAPTGEDWEHLLHLMTIEMKLDGITKSRVEQFTHSIEEQMPNFAPSLWGIIFSYGFTLARNTIREEGSFLKGVEKLVEMSCQHDLKNREEIIIERKDLLPITIEIKVDGSLKRRIEDIVCETKNAFPESDELISKAFGNMLFAGFMSFRKILSSEGDIIESLKKVTADLMREEAKHLGE